MTWAAFALTAVTGVLMFITNATRYFHNGKFRAKLCWCWRRSTCSCSSDRDGSHSGARPARLHRWSTIAAVSLVLLPVSAGG